MVIQVCIGTIPNQVLRHNIVIPLSITFNSVDNYKQTEI